MAMIRRFVNIVAEKCRSGVYSVHRLDVSKHLFYPTTAHAHSNATAGMIERLPELPAPCVCIQPSAIAGARANSSKMPFFVLVSPSGSDGRILCINDSGDSCLFDADERLDSTMPNLPGGFQGPVSASLSIPQATAAAGAKEEEGIYIMHGGGGMASDGGPVVSRFDALRFRTTGRRWSGAAEGWYWQSLPLSPPFAAGGGVIAISSYTVLEGGRTICLSLSPAEGAGGTGTGTYCFDTVRGEWWRAGDWVLPFAGRAEYVADFNIWLGISPAAGGNTGHSLCAASVLPAMASNQLPLPQDLWQDHTPAGEGMAATTTKVNLLNLGSRRFAIAKFCKVARGESSADCFSDWDNMVEDDEFLVLTGMEVRRNLQIIQHKSIRYMCSHNNRIHMPG